MAAEHQTRGDVAAAATLYQQLLDATPGHPEANFRLGLLRLQTGQPQAALPHLKAALEAQPEKGLAWLAFLEGLLAAKQFDAARSVLDQGRQRGLAGPRVDALEARLGQAVAVQAQIRQMEALFSTGQYAALETAAKAFLAHLPENGKGWHLLGLSLVVRGNGAQALPALLRASELLPQDVDVWDHLGSAYLQTGQLPEAVVALSRAISLRPDHAVSYNNLGNVFLEMGQLDAAEEQYRRALNCQPHYAQAAGNLGIALQGLGHLEEALTCYTRALAMQPDDANILANSANVLKELGRTDAAIAAYAKAMQHDPNHVAARTNFLLLQAFATRLQPQEFLAAAKGLGRVHSQLAQQDGLPPLRHPKEQGWRLRVGYVSGDFCANHPVPFFLEPLLANHDRERVELFLYPTHDTHDATAKRITALGEHVFPLMGLTDKAATEQIRSDGIDVLIDLSGHCRYNRLGVFARRAAPVQAHYLGYCATTGIAQMDYWIGDAVLFPENEPAPFCETVWRLPRTWMSYAGRTDLPPSAWKPDPDGTIWFGSCNHLSKIQDATLDLWGQILRALPNSKLLLKSGPLDQPANRERILAAFAARGITGDRLELLGSTPDWPTHMATYDRMDIALDPLDAVSGATTTCDALWMGVPVLTLAGGTVATRMAASLIAGLGQTEWIAPTPAAYVSQAVRLAADVEGRRHSRPLQRSRMQSSPLGDAKGLAQCLEEAFAAMLAAR